MRNRNTLYVLLSALFFTVIFTSYFLLNSKNIKTSNTESIPASEDVNTEASLYFSFLKHDISDGIIFKGLPSQNWKKDEFSKELEKPHFKKGDDFFYNVSKKIDDNFISHIKRSLQSNLKNKTYMLHGRKMTSVSFCGGFHADYMVTLNTDSQKIDIQICYGCNEIRLYIDDTYVGEYRARANTLFKDWTDPYADLG